VSSSPAKEVATPRRAKASETPAPPPPTEEPNPPRREKANGKPEDVVAATRCTNCGSTHLTRDYERGELVCDECGLVLEESMIDQGP
jgi:hypothetical protein